MYVYISIIISAIGKDKKLSADITFSNSIWKQKVALVSANYSYVTEVLITF